MRLSVSFWRRLSLLAMALAFAAPPAQAHPCPLQEADALRTTLKPGEIRQVLEECVASDPRDPKVAYRIGRLFLSQRDAEKAVSWLERATRLDPARSEYQLWLGRAYGEAAIRANVLRQPALARRVRHAFERAVELDPNNLAARLSLVQYYLRAPAPLGGSVEKARAEADQVRRRDSLRGHRAWGRIAEQEKRFDAAAEEYERAIAEFPQSPDPIYWRADLAQRRKDYATAFDRLEILAARSPSEPEALYRIGELAATSGQRLDRGVESLKLYLEHQPTPEEPSLASAHYRLGEIYDRQKDRALARREYEAALELDPMLTEARQALMRVR